MKRRILMDNEEFWNTIEDWTDPTIVNAEFCGHTLLHEKIYEECKKYNNWTHSFTESDWSEELKYNVATLSGADPSRWEAIKVKFFSKESYGITATAVGEDWEYSWAVPHKEDFPTIYEFMEDNPKYINPVLSKLGANDVLSLHEHGDGVTPQFLYNMSINEPEGSKLAIYPTGIIPYKPGDIYKLYVQNKHAVINGNEARYHLMFRGGRD
jgi:hypothetical protein